MWIVSHTLPIVSSTNYSIYLGTSHLGIHLQANKQLLCHIVWPDSSIHIICHNICPLKLLLHSKRSATLEGSTVVWGINHLNTKFLAQAVRVSHIWNHRLIPTLAYKSSEHDTDSSHAIQLPNPSIGFYCKDIGVSYQSTYDTIQSFSCWNLQRELDMQDTCSRHVLTLKQKDTTQDILISSWGCHDDKRCNYTNDSLPLGTIL